MILSRCALRALKSTSFQTSYFSSGFYTNLVADKVAVDRAFVVNPEFIVADEPKSMQPLLNSEVLALLKANIMLSARDYVTDMDGFKLLARELLKSLVRAFCHFLRHAIQIQSGSY